MPAPALLAVLLLAGSVPAPALPGDPQPTPTGDVWVEMVPAEAGKPAEGVGRGVIEAPPERVFRALADYAHWDEFMPFLKTSDARPQPDGSVLSTHRMDLPSPLGERRYRVRLTQSAETGPEGKVWRIRWSYVPGSGNVAGHRGSWTLTALGPGRTLAVCRLYTDPGGRTPRWMIDRGTAKMLPWIFHGLRQHVRRSRYDGP
ncbi:MAG TPA: SRPBCC family protein [Thermoanaerobaculia bacterium]|nr:SRPBCC family protein [Thermoanaerobaculia bacterium]